MQFEDLTAEQQAAYLSFMLLIRPIYGQGANIALWIELITTLWTNEIQAIHQLLDASAVIPDNTGYPNSAALDKPDVTAMLNDIAGIFAIMNDVAAQARAVKAVGPENIHTPPAIG